MRLRLRRIVVLLRFCTALGPWTLSLYAYISTIHVLALFDVSIFSIASLVRFAFFLFFSSTSTSTSTSLRSCGHY
jgi:hypothetical protein